MAATRDARSELSWFIVERHLDPMLDIATELGDDLLNVTPNLPGANSGYVILWHSVAVVEWWTRHVILGREVNRSRNAEFTSSGTLASLTDRLAAVRRGFLVDLEQVDLNAPPASDPGEGWGDVPDRRSARGVLLHLLEELAQHHGHLQITRDLLLQP